MGPKAIPPIHRVLPKLSPEPNSGCWLWTGNVNHKGYGQVGVGKSGMRATHRVCYEHFNGDIPSGMQVLHSCDVPCCCNPDHLSIGTHQDNIDDKMRKGRHVAGRLGPRGVKNGLAKLNDDAVRDIRKKTFRSSDYAKAYGVTRSLIWAVQTRKIWRHVDG